MDKSAEKPKKPLRGAAAGKGRGRGPKPGAANAGRPKEEHRELAKKLLSEAKTLKSLRTILGDPENRNFAGVFRYLYDRAHGREPVSAELKLPKTLRILVAREDRR